MSFAFKKAAAPLMLASFLSVSFFSFAAMAYGPDGRMQGDCPFSAIGASLCPQSALPGAIHYISAYSSFLNVPVNSGILVLIIAMLIAIIVLALPIRPLLFSPLAFVSHHPPLVTSHDRKIKRWLSLFENSPSF
jgi:hypothetical protein